MKDGTFQVGARRTIDCHCRHAWDLLTSSAGVAIWLDAAAEIEFTAGEEYALPDGTRGEIRVVSDRPHLRMTWQPVEWGTASTIQLRVIPKGGRSTVAFHQEGMPGPEARQQRRDFFKQALDRIEELVKKA